MYSTKKENSRTCTTRSMEASEEKSQGGSCAAGLERSSKKKYRQKEWNRLQTIM